MDGFSLVILSILALVVVSQLRGWYRRRQDDDELPVRLPDSWEEILMRRFTYYRNLSSQNKIRFGSRLVRFINDKNFLGRADLQVTDEMRVLIAASAIKLSFGFTNYLLPLFDKIFIYPEEYYSNVTHRRHKGEANPAGVLVFSWKDLVEGIADEHDNLNLGLHEFAHAYIIQQQEDDSQGDDGFEEHKEDLLMLMNSDLYMTALQKSGLIRDYAFTNQMEFFAVIVEYFFESPELLQRETPKLYQSMVKILNQDPLMAGTSTL